MAATLLSLADTLLFLCISLSGIYLFVFALASMRKRVDSYPKAKSKHRFALLLPADAPTPALDYPTELYDIHPYVNLHEAVPTLDDTKYDVAVVLGESSRVSPSLLQEVNNAYDAGITAMQLHHIIEPRHTPKLRRQAVGEETNHAIFKQGHTRIGLSSAMDGTDMAMELTWLQKNLKSPRSNLERRLLRQRIFIEYLEQAIVYSTAPRTRTHEIAGGKVLSDFPEALFTGNWDYADKLFQRLLPSWKVLLSTVGILSVATTCYNGGAFSIKWWILLFCLLFTVCLAIPDYLVETKKKRKSKKD